MEHFNYTINGKDYAVDVENVNDLMANVKVNGVAYQIMRNRTNAQQVAPAREAKSVVAEIQMEEEATSDLVQSDSKSIMKSPLPGIILEIKCKVGDAVKIGQPILILEAMKMENAIAADRDGVIKQIIVTKGTTVLEGEDLVVIG